MKSDGIRRARWSGRLVIRCATTKGRWALSGQASQARFASHVEAQALVIGHADRAERWMIIGFACRCRATARASNRWRRSWRRPGFLPNINRFCIWSARRPGWRGRFAQKIHARVSPGGDATVFTKKGTHSVGAARQYRGRLGKQDSRQIAVTLPIACRLRFWLDAEYFLIYSYQ